MQALSRKESRAVDRRAVAELKIPSICLMENAGAGASGVAREMLRARGGTVAVACGPGGNGGDAMVAARHLAVDGVDVTLVRFGRWPSGDAGFQASICAAMGLAVFDVGDESAARRFFDDVGPFPLVIDGLYGTGLDRAVDGVGAALIEAMNAAGAPILALDLPSGLDCDTGEPLGPCVRASVTATFGTRKRGFDNPASRAWTGDVRVVGIGAPTAWPAPRA